MKRTVGIITVILLLVIGIGGGIWALIVFHPPPRQITSETPTVTGGLLQPSMNKNNDDFTKGQNLHPRSTPPPQVFVAPAGAPPPAPEPRKRTPIRIYTSTAPSEPEPEELVQGYYAPAYRIVRCALVNTVDSSDLTTPILGLVTDDLIWDGHKIIGKFSEVHGTAQLNKSRERIASEGVWTFTIRDPANPGLGRELVLKGIALDSEYDPEFAKLIAKMTAIDTIHKTWGITEGGAGLRGVVVQVDNAAIIKLFVASFFSGLAQSVQGTTTNIFGQTSASQNVNGAGGVSGAIINPPAQGLQAALDNYAQIIMKSIETDGYFVRVPAGKLFEVCITEAIDTGKATVGGSRRIAQVEEEYLRDRDREERVTEPRATRDREKAAAQAQQQQNSPPQPGVGTPINPALTRRLDDESAALQQQADQLRQQANQLAEPTAQPPNPGPNPTP